MHWIVEWLFFSCPNSTPHYPPIATPGLSHKGGGVVASGEWVGGWVTHTHPPLERSCNSKAGASRWGPGLPDVERRRSHSSEPESKRGMEGGKKEGRIGMGYTTHDKHIHPHYCNNPPATHQCSISLPLSPSLTINRSLSFTHTRTHTHYRQYISNGCISEQKLLNSTFMHHSSYLISELQNKNHFSAQYCQSGEVPHQYSCWITNECFLWLSHWRLITYSCSVHGPWKKLREALRGLSTKTHTYTHGYKTSC